MLMNSNLNSKFVGLLLLLLISACSPVINGQEKVDETPLAVSFATAVTVEPTVTTEQMVFTDIGISTPTLVATPIHISTPTATPIDTPTTIAKPADELELSSNSDLLFLEAYDLGYSRYDHTGHTSDQLSDSVTILDYHSGNDGQRNLEIGPADAQVFAFANYANKMAYWIEKDVGQLWVADLELTNPQLIFTEQDQTQIELDRTVNVSWTPDDLHIIFSATDNSFHYIYHIENNEVEPWPWICDRVAVSPRTNKLAIWCAHEKSEQQFAVVEWGGEIWYSATPPDDLLLTWKDESFESIGAWSSDGEKFAYFDLLDPAGSLYIVDNQGNQQLSFSGVAWWFTDAAEKSLIFLPAKLIHWSEDSSRLLIFAHKLVDDVCYQYENIWSESDELFDVPCWQLIDAQSGELLWNWSDVLSRIENDSSNTWQVWEAAISPQGKKLAFRISVSGNVEIGIVDLENDFYEQSTFLQGSVMRWGSRN